MFDPYENPIKHPITKAHYARYETYRTQMGMSLTDNVYFGTREDLDKKYREDPELKNIPLDYFLPYHIPFMDRAQRIGLPFWGISRTIDLLKHCIIFQILDAIPVFTDEG